MWNNKAHINSTTSASMIISYIISGGIEWPGLMMMIRDIYICRLGNISQPMT